MTQMKTIEYFETANRLINKFKALSYEVYHVYPNMVGLNAHVKKMGTLHQINFSPEIAAAITAEGQRALLALSEELKKYDIDTGLTEDLLKHSTKD